MVSFYLFSSSYLQFCSHTIWANLLHRMGADMRTLNLSTASAWEIGQFLESERQRGMGDHLDDREPEEEPVFLGEED